MKNAGNNIQSRSKPRIISTGQADAYLKSGSTGVDEKQLVDCVAITKDNVDKLTAFVFEQ